MRTAKNLAKIIMSQEEGQFGNTKQYIKDIIIAEIKERKSNLVQVKDYIEKQFQKPLKSIDNAYVEQKYLKYCSEYWLQEVKDFLKRTAENKSSILMQEIFNSLDKIESLSNIYHFFKQLEYYQLLIKHYKLIRKENEKILISRFKRECLEQTFAYSDSAEKELVFLETFVDFLSYPVSLESIIAKLKLEDFCYGELSFGEFLKGVIDLDVSTYGESLAALKKTAKCLQKEEGLFLIDKYKEVIGAYIKPVEIQESEIDGRLVIEVTGKNVVVSKILCPLENKLLENANIEEVRFVGADIIHIDTNLGSEVWRGKNIAILTKAIKVHNEVEWNVSGKDNNHIYNVKAGTGGNGHGEQGKDGYPGESGGNVLILVEKIENPEKFTIISNGGKGSKGQGGGNGRDGKEGKCITKEEFYADFPAVADTFIMEVDNKIKKTLRNIKKYSETVKTVWCPKINNATIENMLENRNLLSENIFIETVTNQGGGITFSYHSGFFSSSAFLLYKGSLGQPGGHGGEYGLGGQGGYAGEIIVSNLENTCQEFGIIIKIKQGGVGENGQGGLHGSHGKNGWDMGYLDHQFWEKPLFRYPGKYNIKYRDDNEDDRVWCAYTNMYADITSNYNENRKQMKYEERKNTRQNNDRKHHAQAVRKKNILISSILSSYPHHLRSIKKCILQDLRTDLENTKLRALQAITESKEQQENQTIELGIKRHAVRSIYHYKNKHSNETAPCASYERTTNVNGLINKLKCEPQLLDNWLQLRCIELSRSHLDDLFSNFEAVKTSFLENLTGSLWYIPFSRKRDIKNKLKYIEQLLIDKYRLATLRNIATQLPPYQEATDNIELTLESTVRYLIEEKEMDNNISHPILGTLNQYLYENSKDQREKISKFCEEELQSSDESRKILKRYLKTLFLEVGKSDESHPGIKKYYDQYIEFLEKQEHSLYIFFDAFENELSRPRHKQIYDLCIESKKDKSLRSGLNGILQKDYFLYTLYNRFNNQRKLEYDWDKCCKDKDILKEFNDYIREKGSLSESYRELLAYVFDINIRLYTEDQDNGLSLQDSYNSPSKKAIHVLFRANEFIQLNINENYLRLEEECKKKDDLYGKILKEIEQLKQKEEFDDYLESKAFLADNALSEDKQYFEEEDIKQIIEYFSGEEKQQLKPRLEKIKCQYIGQQGILHYILMRFSSEGKHVSYEELCYLINSILTSIIEERKEQNTFCWIVAAYSQRNWIDELILLQLEYRFKRQLKEKSKWRKYLSKIKNKNILLLFGVKLDQGDPITNQCIEDTLHLLSNIPREPLSLAGLELSEWPYVLKEKYWLCKLLPLANWQESEKLPTASYYLLSIENTFGTDLVEKLLEALKEKQQELSPDFLTAILSNFHNEKWNLSEEEIIAIWDCNISEWTQKMQQKFIADDKERDITQLVKLIKGNANTSKEITDNLAKIADSMKSICDENYVIGVSFTENDIDNWVKEFRKSSNIEGKENIENEMLAVIDRAIELKRGFRLRDTQRLTVLTLLTNNHDTLAQVSTGEGKSLIVVAASLMMALCGEKVDIITSSSVLAKRDAEGNRDIYNLFGINVSHNCSEDIEKRKEAYSSNEIVYGDLSNFQRDYLLDRFYGKNILGDHNFTNVIVDEVDSMLLDKGNNMLYLSHDLPDLDKLESVYIFIWQWINRPAVDHEEIAYAFDIKAITESVVSDLYGLVKKEDIGKLGSELSEQHKIIIWERLVTAEIIDNQGKLLKENIDDNTLKEILSPEFSRYKDRLNYLLQQCIEREKFIPVPNHLRYFVEKNLESWINSAITAFFMTAGQDYVVDVDRTGTSPDRNPNITILDRDTGTDQANSQWGEALHQFLQLKHGCKISLQSLKAVFISNVSFFQLYSNLYGLTGTLGSQRERNLLREIHKVDFVTIPTYKSKQFHEDIPFLCTSKEEWINHIHNVVQTLTKEKKRSVLIICETVNDVDLLHKAFGGIDAKHVHTYIRDYEVLDIAQGNKKLEQGQIIIATNLAGRGTDVIISKGLREAGGLHVCLTYLPSNIRVEQQAFGRAARNGDKGSGQLIVMDSRGQEYSNSRVLDLKKERDAEELYRTSDIKAYYETQITMEETCFKAFKVQYEKLRKHMEDKKVPTIVKGILLQSCLDKWAFWLDENSKCIKNMKDKQSKKNFNNLLDKFISQLKNLDIPYNGPPHDSKCWLAWVQGNPVQMVNLGKYISQNKEHKNDFENAVELFDEVIKNEPYFSEAAHYYKAFVLAKQIDWEQKPLREGNKQNLIELKKELKKTLWLLDERSKFATNAAGIIGKIKENNNACIIQIDAYEKQKKSVANLYYIYSQSIDDIFGRPITPQSFVNYDITEEMAESLYNDLLEKGILKKPRVKKNITEEKLKTISSGYGLLVGTLKSFLSGYQDINIMEFQNALKKAVPLPSREEFWKLLIQGEVLRGEVKYVVVDSERLREIDPSLLNFLTEKVDKKELKKQTLEHNNGQILLNVEWITQQNNNGNVFKKGDFIEIVGKGKYKILKGKRVLSFNKKADIDKSRIESTALSCYDSINIEDFTNKANITKREAEKVIAELVKQNILEKKDSSENSAYGLKIKFEDLKQFWLPSCPVYENDVKGLLSMCFAYRIVLQSIVKQLDEENFPISLQLKTAPHQSLFFELLEQKIIRPSEVKTQNEDLEKKLKSLFGEIISNDTIKNIVNTLKKSKGSLNALEVPDIKLKPLTEYCGESKLVNAEEVYVCSLNGLDLIIHFIEKKWTLTMILNTIAVTALGICQIALGTIIELFSVGIMTHVGAALVNEGVSDLFFASGALTSGYFSWEDYRQHKLESLKFTALTVGIGALFSNCAKVSRFGHKLVGPTFEVGGKTVAKTAGTKLIKIAGSRVAKDVAKRVTLKAIEGIAFGLANAGVDAIVANYLRSFCDNMASDILSNVQQEVERHKISISLEEAYEKLGEETAKDMVNNLTKSVLTEKNVVETFFPLAKNIATSVTQGFANAGKNTNSKWGFSIHTISRLVVWAERGIHIANIIAMVSNFLDNLDEKMRKKLDSDQKKDTKLGSLNQKREGYEEFKKEMTDQWKSSLKEKAGRVISEHIVSPILKDGANHMVKYVGKQVKGAYKSYKERGHLKHFKKLKQEYLETINSKEQCDNTSTIEDHITEKYHKDLLTLMNKTKNPVLFAEIVRENIPMDMTCVSACTHVITKILKERGVRVSELTIIVEGNNGIRQVFSSASQRVEGKVIKLKLQDNHFQLCKSAASESNRAIESKNNCLYEALADAIPCIRDITPKRFRAEIANCIERDEGIRYHIQQGWHQFPISIGAFGGRSTRERSRLVHDFESPSIDTDKLPDYKTYKNRVREVPRHLQDRLERFIRFGGIVQRVSEQTNVNRYILVAPGASRYQDKSSNKGRDIHAAHVIRAGKIHPKVAKRSELYYNELVNNLGHTQNVPKYANVWHGIGGKIDRFQSKVLKRMATINFRDNLTPKDASTLTAIKMGFIAELDKEINKRKISEGEKSELIEAKRAISNVTIESLFKKGKRGYSNDGMGIYR